MYGTAHAFSPTPDVHIRNMTPDDRDFILALTSRFAEAGVPAWRDPARALRFHQQTTETSAAAQEPDVVLVAEDAQGTRLGFIHLIQSIDFLTGEAQGYVAALAVTTEAEGMGVGRVLMGAGEDWARRQRYRILALDTFAANTHARSFYQRLGYVEETVKLIKEL
jgi:GNAT superfamily N-acetyltransferase